MPQAAPRRGRDPIGARTTFRLLWHEVTVEAPDAAVGDALGAVVASAEHPMPALRTMHYGVDLDGDQLTVMEEGDALAAVATVDDVRDTIYMRSHRRAFELASLMGWMRLHGALVDLGEVRVLLTGPSGVGKTTFALRLALDGAAVQGDESVLVRGGDALAVPRPLFLEDGAGDLVPEAAATIATLPRVGDAAALDLRRDLGAPWQLRVAPIDHVVVLEREPGPVECRPSTVAEVLGQLTRELFPVTETKPAMLRTLTGALTSTRCHRLRVGDPAAMQAVLGDAVR